MLRSKRYQNVFLKEEGANPTEVLRRGTGTGRDDGEAFLGLRKLAVPSRETRRARLRVRGGCGHRSQYFMPKDVPFANYVEAFCMART